MKRNPANDAARNLMAPGVLARDGFLGTDSRPIAEIVAADQAVLEEAGTTAEQIADLLDEFHRVADEGLEAPRPVYGGRATVQLCEVMGRIPCPFGCGHRAHKACIRVMSEQGEIILTPMHAHLIRDHGFFQGEGSPFRVAPRVLVDLYRLCRGDSTADEE